MSKSYASSPWKIIRRHNSVADSRVIVTDDRVQTHIAYITPGDGLGHETETVLSTIAAASELLAALKAMVKRYGSPEGWPLDPDVSSEEISARAAIAKAEGGK